MKESGSAEVFREKQKAETSHFAPSAKEVMQPGNSQSIYFVTGGVSEMDTTWEQQEKKLSVSFTLTVCFVYFSF